MHSIVGRAKVPNLIWYAETHGTVSLIVWVVGTDALRRWQVVQRDRTRVTVHTRLRRRLRVLVRLDTAHGARVRRSPVLLSRGVVEPTDRGHGVLLAGRCVHNALSRRQSWC